MLVGTKVRIADQHIWKTINLIYSRPSVKPFLPSFSCRKYASKIEMRQQDVCVVHPMRESWNQKNKMEADTTSGEAVSELPLFDDRW
jgi:hypothetical protein